LRINGFSRFCRSAADLVEAVIDLAGVDQIVSRARGDSSGFLFWQVFKETRKGESKPVPEREHRGVSAEDLKLAL
jgi:hypothetical protein